MAQVMFVTSHPRMVNYTNPTALIMYFSVYASALIMLLINLGNSTYHL